MKNIKSLHISIIFSALIVILVLSLAGCSSVETTTPTSSPTVTTTPASTQSTTSPTVPVTTTTSPATQTSSPKPTATTASPTPTQPAAQNIIVNHTNWDWYNSQAQTVFDSVAQKKIFFAHASVGSNILDGLKALNSSNASKYKLSQITSGDTPPKTTLAGKIYEYPRGNPGWSEKISIFEKSINNGWRAPLVDIVMSKFCYIDQTADWKAYTNSMTALEAKYPDTVFVYFTMPLTTNDDAQEVLRAQFNQNLRQWIAGKSNKVLFDIADIEAWNTAGQQQTFTSNGVAYQKLFGGYSSDGGHLNDAGSLRMATGIYSLIGKIAQATTSSK